MSYWYISASWVRAKIFKCYFPVKQLVKTMRLVQFAITACVAHHIWYVILSSCLTASGIVVSPRNQTVKEGDDAFFNCTKYETNGSDISGLRYSWSGRNGEAVLSNTSQLILKSVSRTDAGFYTCTVTNVSANWSEVVNATLSVWCKYSHLQYQRL